ncbi:MAG: HD domain-containing protein [Clostridia bacterium]|nr:HD domain-containing protein [Clostridia bacterium]
MKKISLFLMAVMLGTALLAAMSPVGAASYMGDKTEVPVDLEVSGAEALCQTEDGYVWIAQYSGLTRYDSKEFTVFKSFEYEGQEYSIINVRALQTKDNVLYIATNERVFVYKDSKFEPLDVETGIIRDIILDPVMDRLYISTETRGGVVYDLNNRTSSVIPGSEGKMVSDIALDLERSTYFFQLDSGVYDRRGNPVLEYPGILDIYSYGDTLFIGEDSGIIHQYNMKTRSMMEDIVVPDQVNKMLYSEEEQILFVACEKNGIYCVDFSSGEPVITSAGTMDNQSQLVDLMIDYQGNLWVASHYIGASGVSIITQNALFELLYDDPVWKSLQEPPAFDRNVYAVEKYGDTMYIVAATAIHMYDMKTGAIAQSNPVMQAIRAYADEKTAEKRAQEGNENYTFTYAPKDVEVFREKLYFGVSGVGLVEYDPETQEVVIYDSDYIKDHVSKTVGEPDLSITGTIRSMRSFDDFLALGTSRALMKFDGTSFSVMQIGSNVLYINKTKDGKILFDRTQGLYTVDDDFTEATEIPTRKDITGNRLKFLVDGDWLYYTLNSRLFRLNTAEEDPVSEEITIPYIKGSIVELAKIQTKDKDGNPNYKYVVGSQTQVYITDSLDGDRLGKYEFYDSTNGLQTIIANTSGFYDEAEQKYYLQSTNGIFVYDFNEKRETDIPVKILISSVDLDGHSVYGNQIQIGKRINRVSFNLSILGFKPNKGYTIYYKLDGVDEDYISYSDDNRSIFYTNLSGGSYVFHVYVEDEYGQLSNEIRIQLVKEKTFYEQWWFWGIVILLALLVFALLNILIIRTRTRRALKRQLEYKNITLEAIQAIARTIDAKDEYTNGHSIRVGYYSKVVAENLGMSQDEVDNIYYIALLHDIGKIAIPDSILNKPGRLTDEEFAVMKSHTTRGAQILKGISTIPQIMEGAKSHHEKYDGTGYPEGLKGEDIPYVARIICCADCFDAMASKRVYKEPFSLEKIIGEFERCSGTQFDPKISKVVVDLIVTGKLKPYTAENTYLGSDGKTHRIKQDEE